MKKPLYFFAKSSFLCLFLISNLLATEAKPTPPYETIKDESRLQIKSPSLEKREAAKIRLPNGLEVYLISDPKANQSAAALAVAVGSWNDPKEYPGMAHFLEHMLFHGTKKYPDPAAFMQFITDNSGMPNAYTSVEKTVYSFSINHDAFPEALDRFSQFFISPLFDPSSIGKELYAVDEEFAKNAEHDGWRWYHVSKENTDPAHPNAMFSTGNAETLEGIPQKRLRSWFENHYSADRMKLVIYSPLPMDKLKEEISTLFSPIPRNEKPKLLTLDIPLTNDTQRGHITYIPTIRKGKSLLIQWELPKDLIHDESKSAKLVCYALTRGHAHSLLEELKKENLAIDLSLSPQKYGSHHLLVEMEIELTDEGASQLFLVMERCYETIASLMATSIPSYLFSEMKKMKTIGYEQQVREDPFRFVEKHAALLLFESLDTYPEKTFLPSSYDQRKIDEVLQNMTPQNGVYYLLAEPRFLTHIPMDKTEKWMKVPYAVHPLAPSLLAKWEKINPNSSITLPSPNPYIPSELSYLSKSDSNNEPIKIAKGDRGLVFFHPANDYEEPNVTMSFCIKSPITSQKNSPVLGDLFVMMANKQLDAILLQARAGGLSANISYSQDGLLLEISGFSEKAPLLLQTVLQKVKTLNLTKEDFSQILNELSDMYENGQKELPIMQANELLSSLVDPSSTPKFEKKQILSHLSFEDLVDFSKELFEFNYVEGFISGNLTLKDAESLWVDVEDIIARGPYPLELHTKPQSYAFPEQEGPFVIEKTTDALGTGVILAIDEGEFTFEKRAAQQILSQAINDAFFTALRSEQKTGYIVHGWSIEKERHLYQMFGVQSSTHDAKDLLVRFEIFIDQYLQDIEKNISEERFSSIQNSVTTLLKTPPKNLNDFLSLQRLLAFEYEEDFGWLEKRVEGTENLSYDHFISYVKEFLSRKNKKRIAIEMQGGLAEENLLQYHPLSIDEMKSKGSYVSR